MAMSATTEISERGAAGLWGFSDMVLRYERKTSTANERRRYSALEYPSPREFAPCTRTTWSCECL